MTPLPRFDLAGQVALVTGASSGIGRHLALLLAAAGAKVALAARRVDRLAEAAREIESDGGECLTIVCDVTRPDSVAAAIAKAEAELGPLAILVNNAGVVVSKPVLEHTEAEWDYVVDTNLKGAWLMARAFAEHLIGAKRSGRIVNIASVLGTRTIARVPSYCAAKAGLIHLTQVLAMELARHGILVNALAPGYVETDFNREFLRTEPGQRLVCAHSAAPRRAAGRSRRRDAALGLAGGRLYQRRGDRGRWRARRCRDLTAGARHWRDFSPRRPAPFRSRSSR